MFFAFEKLIYTSTLFILFICILKICLIIWLKIFVFIHLNNFFFCRLLEIGQRQIADFVFLIDCSSSMQANIDAVRLGMPNFVDQIRAKNADAQYAVVLFALEAEVILDWTDNGLLARDVLKQVIAGNGNNFRVPPNTLVHFDVSEKKKRKKKPQQYS